MLNIILINTVLWLEIKMISGIELKLNKKDNTSEQIKV